MLRTSAIRSIYTIALGEVLADPRAALARYWPEWTFPAADFSDPAATRAARYPRLWTAR